MECEDSVIQIHIAYQILNDQMIMTSLGSGFNYMPSSLAFLLIFSWFLSTFVRSLKGQEPTNSCTFSFEILFADSLISITWFLSGFLLTWCPIWIRASRSSTIFSASSSNMHYLASTSSLSFKSYSAVRRVTTGALQS